MILKDYVKQQPVTAELKGYEPFWHFTKVHGVTHFCTREFAPGSVSSTTEGILVVDAYYKSGSFGVVACLPYGYRTLELSEIVKTIWPNWTPSK